MCTHRGELYRQKIADICRESEERLQGFLIHTTDNWNDGVRDEMHGKYMTTTSRIVSWHVTVDKNS
ncbi:hypothetical protein [Longirhabdus pacifica]|uniref:hypothetical protein n=1 Tax=Longirhabdus pacifica TaxID=2305227 RepID=UPI001F0BF8A1|nr:hypothetical protein [Longirhabdus pacifica]